MPYDPSRIFFSHAHQAGQLRLWLAERSFNNIHPYLRDRQGNPMIGLNQVDGEHRDPRGIIIVTDGELFEKAVELAEGAKTK